MAKKYNAGLTPFNKTIKEWVPFSADPRKKPNDSIRNPKYIKVKPIPTYKGLRLNKKPIQFYN